jgi:hypothetical protein
MGYVKREHALSYEYNVYALTRMHEPPLTGMFCVVHIFQLLPYGRHIWSLAPIKQFCSICVPFRLSGSRGHSGGMGPQRILWGLGRRAWGLRGSCGHSGGAHGALADPVGTYIEVGVHEAFTARSMVTEPTEERGGDQRYSPTKGMSNIQHGLVLTSICVSCLQALMVP